MNRETQWNRWERQSLQGYASWELFVKRTKIKMKHSFSGIARLPGAGSHPQWRRSERNSLFLICEPRSAVLGLWFTNFLGFILTPPQSNFNYGPDGGVFYPYHKYFLGAFAKFLKAIRSSDHVCPSTRNKVSLDGFSGKFSTWNICRKSVETIQVSLKSDMNNRYFIWEPMYNYISLNSC
jgi:hypothetical protein